MRSHLPPLAQLYFWLSDRFYNELAWTFDFVTQLLSGGRWTEWRQAALPHVRGNQVVELGSGTGELLLMLAHCGVPAYGLDISPAMLRLAARKLHQVGRPSHGIQADALALPFASHSLHTLVSIFPAGFLLEATVLKEVHRVLKDSPAPGRLVVVGLCLQSPQPFVRWAMRLLYSATPEAVLADFTLKCEAVGLSVEEIYPGRAGRPIPVIVVEKRPPS